ncbi:MAG: toll/interleukin-1 receptor domain-containing protein [Halioglobus sp.]
MQKYYFAISPPICCRTSACDLYIVKVYLCCLCAYPSSQQENNDAFCSLGLIGINIPLSRDCRVFCSYSSADRGRVTGLGLLLEALGHEIFLDHKTIKPGSRWQTSLQTGLDQADVLLAYWTRSASLSEWVRKEIEYFHVHYPHRLIVPVLGDETPLSELLDGYQHSDFCPLINELLLLKRTMASQGAKPAQIQVAISKRLGEAGIELEGKDLEKLFKLFATAGFLGLISAPVLNFQAAGNRIIELLAQLSRYEWMSFGTVALLGAIFCNIAGHTQDTASGFSDSGSEEYPSAKVLPTDVWLGMWTLTDSTSNNSGKSDTFRIIRTCNEYALSREKGAIILQIIPEHLRFTEGLNEYVATMQPGGVAEVIVTSTATAQPHTGREL